MDESLLRKQIKEEYQRRKEELLYYFVLPPRYFIYGGVNNAYDDVPCLSHKYPLNTLEKRSLSFPKSRYGNRVSLDPVQNDHVLLARVREKIRNTPTDILCVNVYVYRDYTGWVLFSLNQGDTAYYAFEWHSSSLCLVAYHDQRLPF
jgi:hypothetical protein